MAFSTFNTFSSCNANMNWITQPSNGGTVTYNGEYYIHTFTTSGNLTFYHNTDVSYLIVGGGGGGGHSKTIIGNTVGGYVTGGGGGGGNIIIGSTTIVSGRYNVEIGLGGIATGNLLNGQIGGNTSFNGIIAEGGGGGAGVSNDLSNWSRTTGPPNYGGGSDLPGSSRSSGGANSTSGIIVTSLGFQSKVTGNTVYSGGGGLSSYNRLTTPLTDGSGSITGGGAGGVATVISSASLNGYTGSINVAAGGGGAYTSFSDNYKSENSVRYGIGGTGGGNGAYSTPDASGNATVPTTYGSGGGGGCANELNLCSKSGGMSGVVIIIHK